MVVVSDEAVTALQAAIPGLQVLRWRIPGGWPWPPPSCTKAPCRGKLRLWSEISPPGRRTARTAGLLWKNGGARRTIGRRMGARDDSVRAFLFRQRRSSTCGTRYSSSSRSQVRSERWDGWRTRPTCRRVDRRKDMAAQRTKRSTARTNQALGSHDFKSCQKRKRFSHSSSEPTASSMDSIHETFMATLS